MECNSKADFLCNKKKLTKVPKKRPILKDYKDVIIKTFKFFDDYFDNQSLKKFKKIRILPIDLKNCLRNKNTINHFKIKNLYI